MGEGVSGARAGTARQTREQRNKHLRDLPSFLPRRASAWVLPLDHTAGEPLQLPSLSPSLPSSSIG